MSTIVGFLGTGQLEHPWWSGYSVPATTPGADEVVLHGSTPEKFAQPVVYAEQFLAEVYSRRSKD
jgi:hypothetical protein